MNVGQFIDTCEKTFGSGKVRLMPDQQAVYYQKLQRFSDEQLSAIYDKVLEVTAHFPKVKDCYDVARELGYLNEENGARTKPHAWEPTDCRFCGGYGLMGGFYEQEFEIGPSGKMQILKLVHIVPYHQSAERHRSHPNEVRTVYRCQCPSGDLETIPHGLPRWHDDRPAILKRPWG